VGLSTEQFMLSCFPAFCWSGIPTFWHIFNVL